MSSFKFAFLEACENLKLKPNNKVLRRIDEACNSISLNLSAVEFDLNSCKALGSALSNDVILGELDLSNCMLNSDGLVDILSGLEKNRCLKTLNLKGNNIKSVGTEAIGKFLRHNTYLENLYLEWNGLGIFPEKFSYFCEGLSVNTSLKCLDLKNNQLNHICGQLLAAALCRNSSIQRLDLRWNCIGLLGGRDLLKALGKNTTILKIEVSGNDIPAEIQESIETLAISSAEKCMLKNENAERTKVFSSKLQEIETENSKQLKILMEQLDRKDSEMMNNHRWNSLKQMELQEALSEKDSMIETFKKRYKDLERELIILREEKNKLALELNETGTNIKEKIVEYQQLLDKERSQKENIQRKLLEEIGSLKEENIFMKQEVQDLKTLNINLEDRVMKLQNSLKSEQSASKAKENSFNDQLSLMKEKQREEMSEVQQTKKREISKMRNDFLEVETILKDKISHLQSKIHGLEKTLSEKEHQLMAKQIQEEEKIEELKREMKEEEERVRAKMEEKIKILETANKKLEDKLKEQLHTMLDIKKMLTENDLLLAEEAHRTEKLQKELEAKDAEIKKAVAMAHLETKEKQEELEHVKKLLLESEDEKAALKKQIEGLQKKFKEEIVIHTETLNAEVQRLKNKVKTIRKMQVKRNEELSFVLTSHFNSIQSVWAEFSNSEDDSEEKKE